MTGPQTRIHLCGRLRIELEGRRIEDDLRGRQGRLLFAYLVLHRDRPVRREELVEALWPEGSRPPSETALAPVLSRLRSALAPATIEGRDQLVLVLPGEEPWVDVEAARAALVGARSATEAAEAVAAAREAAQLVAAGLLPGNDADWIERARGALEELRVEALELVAREGVEVDPAGAEEAARAAVAAAPFRESARSALIEVLRRRGNVAEAVRAYEDLRVLLRDELGTVPGPDLVALHARLLAPGPASAAPPDAVRAAPSPPAMRAAGVAGAARAAGVAGAARTAAAAEAALAGPAAEAALAGPAAEAALAGPAAEAALAGPAAEAALAGPAAEAALAGPAAEAALAGPAAGAARAGASGEPALPPRRTAAPPPAPADLVEREAELAVVDDALARLSAGHAGLLLFEGPAGIGKTRLLTELRTLAAEVGARPLTARASVLERDFGFGVVRQLLEPATDEADAYEGVADPARAVLGDVGADATGPDRSFAALHALFRLTAALAARQPLVLCIDDLQWSDLASLRFVAYLARRLDGLAVLVAATVRTGEPSADDVLMAEIGQDPASRAVRPAPLSTGGTAGVVRGRLGAETDPAFAAACHDVTGGNPLLLRQLLTALSTECVPPDAAHAAEVRAIGPRAVSRTILLRLARMAPDVVAVARGLAILGEQPDTAALAAFVGSDEWSVAEAIGTLARADIVQDRAPVGFVHPLVRDAVYAELPAARRALEHGRAARVLAEAGAGPEAIAVQLARAPLRGDAWVVEQLRAAARLARGRGAPESALAHLERALAELAPGAERTELVAELGEVASMVSGERAVAYLREAHDLAPDAVGRAETALKLGRLLLFLGDPGETPRLAVAAAAELPDSHDDLRQGLEALELIAIYFGAGDPAELERLHDVPGEERGQGPGARSLLGLAALQVALSSGPAAKATALARVALHDDMLVTWDPVLLTVAATQVIALGDPAEGVAVWERIARITEGRGSPLDVVAYAMWGGVAHLWAGDLIEAEAWLERAYESQLLWGMEINAENGYSSAFIALTRLARGDLPGARAALERLDDPGPDPADGARFWAGSHAELLLAEGRAAEVLPITEYLRDTRPPDVHPLWVAWRGLRTRALAALGRDDEARAQAMQELALARRIGAPWVLGRALRLLGELDGSVAVLEEAVRLLAGSGARLEHAKAVAALARALHAGDRRDEAAARASEAHDLASRSGADGLARALGSGQWFKT